MSSSPRNYTQNNNPNTTTSTATTNTTTTTMTMSNEEPVQIQTPAETVTKVPSTDSTEDATGGGIGIGATTSSTTTTSSHLANAKTPPRTSYAVDPLKTPIASVKRPRQKPTTDNNTTANSSRSLGGSEEQTLSPMHGVKPVYSHSGGKNETDVAHVEEEIFSPVAHFVGHTTNESNGNLSDDDESMGHPDLDQEDFNPWQFIQNLPPYETVSQLRPPITLPPPTEEHIHKKTLVLDLDETLVHCSVDVVEQYDLTFPVCFHNVNYTVYVQLRPHLNRFLEKVSQQFEVIVFTASQKVYADALLDLIDPEHKYIHHRLFRESCLCVENNFMKDLTVLGRDLRKTVLVDNSPHAFGYQVDNGIPIESWFDKKDDRELIKLEKLLFKLKDMEDVREGVRAKFENHIRVEQAPALSNMY